MEEFIAPRDNTRVVNHFFKIGNENSRLYIL